MQPPRLRQRRRALGPRRPGQPRPRSRTDPAGCPGQLDQGCGEIGRRERVGQHHGRWRDTILIERRRSPAGALTSAWSGLGYGVNDVLLDRTQCQNCSTGNIKILPSDPWDGPCSSPFELLHVAWLQAFVGELLKSVRTHRLQRFWLPLLEDDEADNPRRVRHCSGNGLDTDSPLVWPWLWLVQVHWPLQQAQRRVRQESQPCRWPCFGE